MGPPSVCFACPVMPPRTPLIGASTTRAVVLGRRRGRRGRRPGNTQYYSFRVSGWQAAKASLPSPPAPAPMVGPILVPSAEPGAWDSGAVARPVVRLVGFREAADGDNKEHEQKKNKTDTDHHHHHHRQQQEKMQQEQELHVGGHAQQEQQQRKSPPTPRGHTWAMWYGGRPRDWPRANHHAPPGSNNDGFAGLALSADGIVWERVQGPHTGGAILEPNKDDWWWFDVAHVALGDVHVARKNKLVRSDGGVYFAYYTGSDNEVVPLHGKSMLPGGVVRTCIGVALSKDGEHWTRIEGEHPSGAVLEPGPPGAFDAFGVACPSVVRLNPFTKRPEYLMHYHAFDPETRSYAIGRALSNDGFNFRRDDRDGAPVLVGSGPGSGAVDECGVSHCCVVERGSNGSTGDGRYVMFLQVHDGNGKTRIAMAESRDALEWTAPQLVLDLPSDPSAWDAGGMSHPSAVVVGDEVWLYYTGQGGTFDADTKPCGGGIGLAKSRGADWTFMERCSPS